MFQLFHSCALECLRFSWRKVKIIGRLSLKLKVWDIELCLWHQAVMKCSLSKCSVWRRPEMEHSCQDIPRTIHIMSASVHVFLSGFSLTHSFIQSFWLLNIILRFSFECKLTTKLKGTVAVLAAGLFLVLQDYYNSCRTRRSFVNLCALRPSYDK